MADLADKKSDYASACGRFAQELLALTLQADELVKFAVDNGFRSDGANPLVDSDLVGGNKHLTAADVAAVVAAAQALRTAMTSSMMRDLRRAMRTMAQVG